MYATVEQLKHYLGITTGTDDALLSSMLARAQAMIDTHTRRTFEYGTAAARTFDAEEDVSGSLLFFDVDCCAVTTVVNGDGVTVTSLQYVTEPRRVGPYFAIRLLTSSGLAWTWTTDHENAITVTGKWAYSATAPEDIAHCTVRLAAWLYRQKDTAADLDRPILAGDGNVIMPLALPKDVLDLLRPYRKVAP